jgi:hypothetical protein
VADVAHSADGGCARYSHTPRQHQQLPYLDLVVDQQCLLAVRDSELSYFIIPPLFLLLFFCSHLNYMFLMLVFQLCTLFLKSFAH